MKVFSSTSVLIILGTVVSSNLYAKENIQQVKVNCDDVKISINTAINNKFNFSAYWNDPGVFPDPPKYTEIGDTSRSKIKNFKFQCPELEVSYNGNMAEIKSTDYQNLLSKLSKYDLEVNIFNISGYKYPNIKEGFFNSSYSFNLKEFNLKTSIWDLNPGDDLSKDILRYHSVKKDSIIGYKVDGGDLKPYLYDRKISEYADDFDVANTIDIFHKIDSSNVGVTIQRIFIDKSNGILRLYGKAPFPSK